MVKFFTDKSNGGRETKRMKDFNCFIRETNLQDPSLIGANFTCSNLRSNVAFVSDKKLSQDQHQITALLTMLVGSFLIVSGKDGGGGFNAA